jgi:PAS domain S-box-containing protein
VTATFCLCAVLLAAFLSRRHSRQLNIALAKVALLMLIVMSVYQAIDEFVMNTWQSHVMDILFATTLALAGVYKVFKQREELHEAMLREVKDRQAAQAELQMAKEAAELSNEVLKLEIEERRETEERLRSSERRFHAAARATNDSIWEWDLETNEIWTTETATSHFGHDRSSTKTLDWFLGIVHPEDRERVRLGLQDAVTGTSNFWSNDYRLRRADGSYAFVLDRGVLDRDEAGKPLRMVGAMSDITTNKISEQELCAAVDAAEAANLEHKHRFEQTPLPMWIYDLETLTLMDVNEAALKHYGYRREEAMRLSILDILPEEDVPEIRGG